MWRQPPRGRGFSFVPLRVLCGLWFVTCDEPHFNSSTSFSFALLISSIFLISPSVSF
jgi:hypothetical protein